MLTRKFISILLLTLCVKYTYQCYCADIPSPKESFDNSAIPLIFVGTVTDIKNNPMDNIVTFKVKKVVKGDKTEKVEIKTKSSQALCGFPFEKDKDYIVYAFKENGNFTANECSRTNLFADAKWDIRDLNISI
jgi:hypothetical protein